MSILDYIKSNRKGREARKLELEAMRDPFLSDAIEGFDSVGGNHVDKIVKMQAQITARTNTGKAKKRSLGLRISAAAVVIIALTSGYFTLMNHRSSMLVAQNSDFDLIIYAPDEYIQKKRVELAQQIEENGNSNLAQTISIVEIENLKDVITPFEPLIAYLPESVDNRTFRDNRTKADHEKLLAVMQVQKGESVFEEAIPQSAPTSMLAMKQKSDSSDTTHDFMGDVATTTSVSKIVKGKVTDQNGEPIVGATIMAKGAQVGTITDVDGNYALNLDSIDDPKLIAGYIGMETVEIPKPKNDQNIVMKENNAQLSEVVITGYGVQKKKDITGSVSRISADEALQGRVAELQISEQSSVSVPVIGNDEYKKYLQNNIKRPTSADCKEKKGTVVIEFNVNESGRPTNIRIAKNLCAESDKEAIRLIENGSDWTYNSKSKKTKVEIVF